jgi:IS1 family transposase
MRWHPQQRVNFAVLEKKNKLWIWLAFDRSGQRLVDWECGNRDAAT